MSQIGAGERVWGYDFLNGVWRLCRVECRHDANYDGPLATLYADVGKVTATAFHPFWVIQGDDLANRPTPRQVGDDEDQGGSLPGRWVNSHDLREGDIIVLKGRGPVTLRRVVQRHEQTPVCNLTVEELHTFAVGEMQVLVHNASGTAGGTRGTLNPQSERIIYREGATEARPMSGAKIDSYKPFDQALSDKQPIRVVRYNGEDYIMEGNHRVYGAAEDGLTQIEVIFYTPEEWEQAMGMPFVPRGTNNPHVK